MTSKPAILPLFPHKVRGREPGRRQADPTQARDSIRFHREAARLSVEFGEDAAVEVGAPALLIGSRPKQMVASPAQSTEVHVLCLPAPSRFARQRLGRKSRVVEHELNDLALVLRQRMFCERLNDALHLVEVRGVNRSLDEAGVNDALFQRHWGRLALRLTFAGWPWLARQPAISV